jgi:O-antigen/teichoic acid export membrane protein
MIWRRLFGYLPASLISGLASFGGVYVYTRLLPPDAYGLYALALTAMGVVYTLTITWAEAAAYRFAAEAESWGELPDHVRTSFGLVLVSAMVGLAATGAALPFIVDGRLRLALIAAMAVMAATPIVNIAQEMRRARQQVGRWAAVRMTQDIGAFALGTFLAWRLGLGAASPLAGLACVLAILACVEGARLMRSSAGGRFRRDLVKRYLRYGYPIALALVLAIALDTGDRFLIALYLGPDAVGVYAAGYGVADKTLGLICQWGAAAGAPMMLMAWEKEGPEAARAISAKVIRAMLLLAMPAACGLALVAHPLSEVMIGEAMREPASHILPWIAFSGLLAGVGSLYFSEAFQLSRRTDVRALLAAIPAGLNIALNIVLLPRLGLTGAVIATLAAYAAALVLYAVVGRRFAPLALPWIDALRIGAACAVMALGVLALPDIGGLPELLLKVATGGLLYTLAALALDAGGVRGELRRFRDRRQARPKVVEA